MKESCFAEWCMDRELQIQVMTVPGLVEQSPWQIVRATEI